MSTTSGEALRSARRIAVIGSPGGGKSWLSTRLAERLRLPLRHIDLLFWQPGWVKTPDLEYRRGHAAWVEEDEWLIDGNYSSTMAVRMARAEAVVWLDLPTWRCVSGIMRRWWIDKARANTPEGCSDHFDAAFLWYTLKFRTTRNPLNRELFRNFHGLKVRLRSRRAVTDLLDSLSPEFPVPPPQARLDDGTAVSLRPMLPEDRPLFLRGLERTSAETLNERFHSQNFQLTTAQLTYLTDVDQKDHLAMGASVLEAGIEVGIGVARCIRSGHTSAAELAVTVMDQYQRQGVARLLVAKLASFAQTRGIDRFTAYVPAERRGLMKRLHRLGFKMIECEDGIALLQWVLPNVHE